MASITLRLLIALNASMMMANRTEIIKWTARRVSLAVCAFSFSTPKMSMQKEVVRAVKAESALLNAAAMIPIVKKIRIESVSYTHLGFQHIAVVGFCKYHPFRIGF